MIEAILSADNGKAFRVSPNYMCYKFAHVNGQGFIFRDNDGELVAKVDVFPKHVLVQYQEYVELRYIINQLLNCFVSPDIVSAYTTKRDCKSEGEWVSFECIRTVKPTIFINTLDQIMECL